MNRYAIQEREGSDTRIDHYAVIDNSREYDLDFVCECDGLDDAELIIKALTALEDKT